MVTCPVCETPNADDSIICERCNSVFEADRDRTVVSTDRTVVAEPGFSAGTGASAARAFASELTPGTVVAGRYEIVLRLGQGGMGTVYKALDLELDRVIALKTIRPDLASSSSALRRLKQETLLARQITHRNVIRVFDLGVADGLRFITMEYLEGQDLKAFVESRGRLPLSESLAIIKQICQGLQAAHAEDVIHRDLKPQNILVASNGRLRLMDFGLARSFEDTGLSRTGAILGTPTYMSPEQALGQPGDARSDIFSLGIICYELLTGQLPYEGRTLSEMFVNRTRYPARPIESADPAVPAWLAAIVMRCLETKPANRYGSVQELLDHLSDPGRIVPAAPAVRGALAAGTMLGSRYRIEAEAGEGGMGKVYRATDLELNRTVALKVVKSELASDARALELLKHEISIASQVSHRNILRIHDLGESDGIRFVSMAWAEGEDLGQLLRRCGALPEQQILNLAIELCEGLQAAHQLGITHRDLKPSNILLDGGSHPCIADFGLAHTASLTEISLPGSTSGTPRYMSPEQVEGTGTDSRTDIYSLGLILYEMAAGKIPFRDDSVLQTMAQRVTEIPASPKLLNPAISGALAATILRCLEREPAKRYPSVQPLLDDLRRCQASALAPLTEAAPAPKRGLRLGIAYSALAVLVALAIGGFLLYRRLPPGTPPVGARYVAVLPFRPLSSDQDIKYKAEGVSDAISSRLASLNSVHAVSSSALERVNLNQNEKEVGRELGANLLVRGSIQGAGDRIAVTANIYNIEQHRNMWGRSYQRDAKDLFALEDEIGNDVIAALDINPTLQERERTVQQPTQNLAAYDLYLKGRDILKNHRDAAHAASALDLFEQAAKEDPNYALAWTGVADASLQLYKTKNDSLYATKALQAAEQARDRNDGLPEVHFALGSVFTNTGRHAEAVKEIKRALDLQPNSDDGYTRLGRAYLATGQKDQSLAAFRQAVKLNPYYWYNHKQLGFGYARFGMPEEALGEFQEQVRQNPNDASGHSNVGAIYFQKSQWTKCIPEFQTAIKLNPNTGDAYSNLGTAYFELNRYAEAISMFEKAVQLNPNKPVLILNLGDAYARTGAKEKATAAYDKAIGVLYGQLQVSSQDGGTLGLLARAYGSKGDYATARDLVRRARSIDPADADLMYEEAVVNANTGRIPEALRSLRAALEHGYSFEYCLSDRDLEALRKTAGFGALKKQFAKRAQEKSR